MTEVIFHCTHNSDNPLIGESVGCEPGGVLCVWNRMGHCVELTAPMLLTIGVMLIGSYIAQPQAQRILLAAIRALHLMR